MRTIKIVDHDTAWSTEFLNIANQLRRVSGNNVLRIDHIGSTSVSGLAAKDVIDIQVTVADLNNPDHVRAFESIDFRARTLDASDLITGTAPDSPELRKQFFREPVGSRRTHIHVREAGRLNQRYALVFRDYLRSNPRACSAYEAIKRQLAHSYPTDIDSYLAIKDPVMDLIYAAANTWALATNWQLDESDTTSAAPMVRV